METPFISIGFFLAAFLATIGSAACSFFTAMEWSVALGVVAVIFAIAGLFFVLRDVRLRKQEEHSK